MSRRRLEAAIRAAKLLEEEIFRSADAIVCTSSRMCANLDFSGDIVTDICERAEVYNCYKFEAVRDGIFCLQYSYDGDVLVVGYGDGGVELLSAKDGKLKRELQRHRLGGLAATCLRFCPQNHQLVYTTSCEGHVTAYDLTNNILHDIATGYNYDSPEYPQEAGHAQRVFALKYHPQNNNIFVTGGWDNHLKIWDSRRKDGVIKTIHGPHVCGDSLDLKGDTILTGSWAATDGLQLWDFGSGQLIETFNLDHAVEHLEYPGDKQKGDFFYSAQFGGDDFIFAGGSGITDVLVINIHTSQVVSEVHFGTTIQAIDSTENGHIFAAGGIGGELKMAKMV
ncbi:hypothetical protein LSH36_10g07056 [Paralvinella palmiformis]|uniref:Anaphase-promoting complex subunit 4-like WD40 domain-containing protein n=1 Tax=Paralvinella palmiformis TaxID=53620 RepID=A0AAD9KF91_9ANNE|nr:hypothetical protein LSH36_10g07056 [Paralvinella palmiformis]